MRRLLASVFLFLFSFQIMPVKEIGKVLFNGLMTEEIHETSGEGDNSGSKQKKGFKPLNLFSNESQTAQSIFFDKASDLAIQEAERLPNNFIPDIFTPPPNS